MYENIHVLNVHVNKFLNQVRAWFLRIAFVREVSSYACVCVCVCVDMCVSAPEAMNN